MNTSFDSEKERVILNSLVGDYKDQAPYSKIKKEIIFNAIQKHMEHSSLKKGLQMGCSNGYETNILAKHLLHLDVVDGSTIFLEKTKNDNQFDNVNYINALFEDYVVNEQQEKYDYIYCNYVLEHVFDIESILRNIKNNLKPKGILFLIVPNRNALSRQIALKMKLIERLDCLTENDLRHGHRRTFDAESFARDITNQGFEIVERKGIVLKILADFQLNRMLKEQMLSKEHIMALNELGESNENLCDSIFVVARNS